MFDLISMNLRFLEFFVLFNFASLLIGKKISLLKIFSSSIICTCFYEILRGIFPQYIQAILAVGLGIISFKMLTNEKILKLLFVWLRFLVLVAIIDFVITFAFIKIFNIMSINQIAYQAQYGLIARGIYIFSLTVIYFIFRFVKKDKDIIDNVSKSSVVDNAIVTFVLLIPNLLMLIYYYFSQELPLILVVVNIGAIILMFIVSNMNTKRNIKLLQAEEELLTEKTYNKTLEALVDGLRTFKHDYNNTLQTIYGYILTDDMPELKNFFNQILNESREITALDKLKPELFKNPSLFGLVTAKFEYARKSDVTMNLEIYGDLDNLDIKTYDFTRMLGIFLDNAIEASAGSEKKVVNLYVAERNNKVTIEISNSFSDTGLKVEELSKKGVSSKGDNRGLGLYKVKEILKKYPRVKLETNSSNGMFLQRLVIHKIKEVSLK